MSKLLSVTVIAALVSTAALAQDISETPDMSGATAPRTALPDVSVHTQTTTVDDADGTPDASQTETTVTVPPHVREQGAPAPHVVDESNHPPMTDPESQLMYVSGGVGESEIAYFKTLKGDYTLKLLMADKEGHLIGNATVAIVSPHDKMVATLNGVGPYLLVKLPAGRYKVTASANGEDVVRNVVVKAGKITALDARF